MKLILILATLAFSTQSFAVLRNCRERADTAAMARQYMIDNGMIKQGEEAKFPDLGFELRWEMAKMVPTPGACFITMSLCTVYADRKECGFGAAVDVLGFKNGQVVSFEEVHETPPEIIAKIGHEDPKGEELSFYYVKFSGESAIAASKSLLALTPYGGFMGTAVRTGKADFDPSKNRDWHVEDATFNLRRGMTAEVLDIQAFQLDGLDGGGSEGYWQGCIQRDEVFGTCRLGPWGQAFIRELIPVP